MPNQCEQLKTNNEVKKSKFSGLLHLLTEYSHHYNLSSYKSGLFWLISFIIVSLIIAKFVFWSHSWDFSWIPPGLTSLIMLFLFFIHLAIGPICRLFCDICHEIKEKNHSNSMRPPRLLLRDFAKKYYSVEYLVNGCLVYFLVFGSLSSYTNLKPAIPLINAALYDELLFRWDSAILQILSFGGVLTFPHHSTITVFFDNVYFQMWTLACITLAITFRDRLNFWRLTSSWCLAFGLSIPVSFLFPSLGPAFYKPELFSHIDGTNSAKLMSSLLEHYVTFKMNPMETSIVSGNGIMAMPSLHCTLVYLSIIVLRKSLPSIGFVLWGFLFLYIIATVYLGWHYLIDGLAGILLGVIAYKISSLWFYEKIDCDSETISPPE